MSSKILPELSKTLKCYIEMCFPFANIPHSASSSNTIPTASMPTSTATPTPAKISTRS